MTTTTAPIDNGVDIEFLRGARDLLTEQPEAATFQWRVTNTWVNGTHSQSSVKDFYGLGDEQSHHTEFVFDGDHPEQFKSEDRGATPIELVLAGLAGCLTAGVATVASHRDIQLRSVKATLAGDQDVRGIMGLDPEIRNGFSGISVTYEIEADASREEIQALVAQSQKRSAVFDVISNPTNITVTVA